MFCDRCNKEIQDTTGRYEHTFSGWGFHVSYHPWCCPFYMDGMDCSDVHPGEPCYEGLIPVDVKDYTPPERCWCTHTKQAHEQGPCNQIDCNCKEFTEKDAVILKELKMTTFKISDRLLIAADFKDCNQKEPYFLEGKPTRLNQWDGEGLRQAKLPLRVRSYKRTGAVEIIEIKAVNWTKGTYEYKYTEPRFRKITREDFLSDAGVIPYKDGRWNATNWLEKIPSE